MKVDLVGFIIGLLSSIPAYLLLYVLMPKEVQREITKGPTMKRRSKGKKKPIQYSDERAYLKEQDAKPRI